ncbi:unnamed protein product [Tilletia laevis]|uniref:Uncharacterized protein n=4 Tax=Tilletia TaxID=13289 RepID=A0A8X7MWE7_9BASI|nr:hypothetical protein CF335_g6139 [Tilletia laevis]KAE8252078.1 hypothetical protein A4X06_0g2428 [Tilletia controversa]KAE8263412.1 hypothetical protein A4X03_0g1701 [Tilletia caries]CAD6941469.1 unnamed protein product [Tilletia laevis]CAD6942587.1 unnamed protein product [Tilletia laevis]
MDKDNMAVAVQVALQIIGQDGAYDSDDEQYCRQALHWLQDPSLDDDERGVFQSGHGRARSKTDADHFMIRDDRCRAGVDGEAIDDEQPKRKGRARMSQEKRRRLARRKEREALILLGLPPIPSSAPAHTSSFRLPPLITNTLANVASSNLSPEDRAAAVEAARVLVASSGFFNQNFRMPQRFPTKAASSEILERRQGSVPNLRSTQSAFCSESSHYTFPSSPEGIDSAFARFHMGDPSGISDYRPRTMTSTSSSSASNRLSSSFGMPSLSRGGSVASSLASTPLQTPDNFAVPLPPTTFPGENICPADARDTSLPFSKNTMGGMNPVGSFGGRLPYHFSHTMSLLTVPNVCVMPPTPHSKATQQNLLSLKHAAKDTQSGIESALPRKDSILNFGSDDVFPSLAAAASRSSKGAKTASMGPKAGFGAIGPPKVTDPSSQGTTTLPAWAAPSRRHSNTSMQSSSGASSSSGSASENHILHDNCYFNMMSSANSGSGLCPADDAIARVEAKWRESHAPFRHDSQLAQTSKHLSIPQGGMQVSGLSSAADRPMGSLGPASSNFSSSASFRPHRRLSMNSVGSPSEDTRLSPSASSFNFNGGFDFGSHAGFGLPGTASPTFAHHGNQLPAPSSALGFDFDMGGPLDCRSA